MCTSPRLYCTAAWPAERWERPSACYSLRTPTLMPPSCRLSVPQESPPCASHTFLMANPQAACLPAAFRPRPGNHVIASFTGSCCANTYLVLHR